MFIGSKILLYTFIYLKKKIFIMQVKFDSMRNVVTIS